MRTYISKKALKNIVQVPQEEAKTSQHLPNSLAQQPGAAGHLARQIQHTHGNRAVQRMADLAREASGDLEKEIHQARSSGQALDSSVQRNMETAFGADFSGVRVHTDPQADQLNQSLSATAFTTGQDIFFSKGEYNPQSSGGQHLLAHELTHVIQQNGAREEEVQAKLTIDTPGDKYEQEANRVAKQVQRQLDQDKDKDKD